MPPNKKKKTRGAKKVRKASKKQRRRKTSKSGKPKVRQNKTSTAEQSLGGTHPFEHQRCVCTHRSHPEDVDGSTRCTKELKFPRKNSVCPECKDHVEEAAPNRA
jgi:hypothetical protein